MKRMAAVVGVVLGMSLLGNAQTAIAPLVIAPPTMGPLVFYQYWPVQFVQFVGTELPYTMIELDVDAGGKTPLYNVVLTERGTGKRVAYTNSDALAAMSKARGEEAYKTQIAFEAADNQNVGAATSVRLSLANGKPLQWRFVQGSDVSEQGAGLTPIVTAVPLFAYREQAAVAGEGTALQVGDVVSTAEVWTEISKPPYFVAYRGAMSLSAHTTVLVPGREVWTIVSSPTVLRAGEGWEMEGERGNHRSLKIDKVDGTHCVITGSDRFQPAVHFTVEAARVGDDWAVERVRYAPVREGEKHFMAMQFSAPLTATNATSNVDLMIGRKVKMATATMTMSGMAADRTAVVQMLTPAYVKGKTLSEETVTTATTITTTAVPK